MRWHRFEPSGVEHRAVDADADVAAVAHRHDAAEAGAEAARHAGLERELRGHAAGVAQRADGFEHAGRPAGVDRGVIVGVELGARAGSVTKPWWPTEPSSVAIARLGASPPAVAPRAASPPGGRAPRGSRPPKTFAPAACSASRKPSRTAGSSPCARRTRAHAASGGIPTPPPARIARRPSPGSSKPSPSGPVIHSSSPAPQLAEAARARPDVLEHEAQLPVGGAEERERPRHERPLVLPRPPALDGGEHVELPRPRQRAVEVGGVQDAVGADVVGTGHRDAAPAERRL